VAEEFRYGRPLAGVAPRRFRLADVPAQPWKNGGGTTREIACWPPGAGLDDFLWRISVARIDAGGPFSRFEGVDRVITLLSGPGVVLRGDIAAGEHALTQPLAPYAFPGDVGVDCTLEGGTSEDFNVMSRRGRTRASVSVLRDGAALPVASCGLLLAVESSWRLLSEDGSAHALAPATGLWWAQAPRGWDVRPEGIGPVANGAGLVAVAIEILPSTDGAHMVSQPRDAA
jgi:environmental stress-induced protein Ves